LHPTDKDLNAANFPNLSVASVEYMKKYGPDTFKFMVTPTMPTIPVLISKATKIDTRDIYTKEKSKTLSHNAIRGARELGLDMEKLMRTRKSKEVAGIASEAGFQEFMREFLARQKD